MAHRATISHARPRASKRSFLFRYSPRIETNLSLNQMTNLPCVAQQHPNQHVVYSLECTPNPELVEKLWSLVYNEKEDLDRSMDVSEKEKNERINRINVIERLEKKILSDKRYTPADVAEFNTLCGKVLEDRAQKFALIRARHVVDFQEDVEKLSSIKAGHRIHEIHKGAALAPRDLMLDLIMKN